MKSKILLGTLFVLCAVTLPAAAEPPANVQKVSFPSGSDTASGYRALPAAPAAIPLSSSFRSGGASMTG